MFGFSDNDVQSGTNAVDPATAPVVSGGSLDQHANGITPTTINPSTPASASDYILTDAPSGALASSDASTIPVQHPTVPAVDVGLGVGAQSDDDLLTLKQSALQELSPLVGHLEQSPEERFRTTMMLIQASDNRDLLREAFQAAKEITDEKVRAQALLDVVNEINYFTQNNGE
jgi:hypothetical protein